MEFIFDFCKNMNPCLYNLFLVDKSMVNNKICFENYQKLNLGEFIYNAECHIYFNEENDYYEEDTCNNEVFCSTILQPFQFDPEQKNMCEQKKMCGSEIHDEKETKHIHTNLLHIRIGNLN